MSAAAEKDFYHLTVSLNKALNGMEAPLKTKHARSAIIMIHKTKEVKTFWMCISRQPLMENRFTAWKFCHLLHKVLREGHECALRHSQNHKKMILEMGKLWGHLHDDIGYCIKAYSSLLVTKLSFHEKNPMYPGNLNMTLNEIAKYAKKDLNLYFQLCVEIFDYLDDIIKLQLTIFSSINTYRMSSMTQQGQCRLAPLICLIQDSNALYDISVRLMFKLHDELPNDVLCGHRDRFNDIFLKLKSFYDNVRPLQYFADLIQVPHLPESSPNFRSQVDFGSYIPPVVLVHQPDPEPIVDDLIETSTSDEVVVYQEEVQALKSIINDRDLAIDQLNSRLEVFKSKFQELEQNYMIDLTELQRSNTNLCDELASLKEMYSRVRLQNDDLELQLTNNPILIQKVTEEEEKLKLSGEKFNKLKTMYTQIRDEHISLLRQQSDSSKGLSKERQVNSELTLEIKSLSHDIEELKAQIAILTDSNAQLMQNIEEHNEQSQKFELQQIELKANYEQIIEKKELENLDLHSTVENLKENSTQYEKEHSIKLQNIELNQNDLKANYETKIQQKELENLELRTTIESLKENSTKSDNEHLLKLQNIELNQNDLKANYETKIQQKDLENLELRSTIESLKENSTKSDNEHLLKLQNTEEQLNKAEISIKQKDEELIQNLNNFKEESAKMSADMADLKEVYEKDSEKLRTNLAETQSKLLLVEDKLTASDRALSELQNEKKLSDQSYLDINEKCNTVEKELTLALLESKSLKESNEKTLETLQEERKLIIGTVENICASTLLDSIQQPVELIPKMITEFEAILNKLNAPIVLSIDRIKDIIYLGHVFVKLYDQCDLIYKSTTEIEKGQDILNKVRAICRLLLQLLQTIQKDEISQQSDVMVNGIRLNLTELNKLIQDLLNGGESKIDLDKLVEIELKEMDIAIEEAANKIIDLLTNARKKDNGIKLEVNEKILDACTTLMECIKILIMKSRVLQKEIVASRKGNATANEFYKRNSQWSEGLISASKSVAKGANYLVEAANNAVVNETGTNFQLIVAAQEIAACTVQLVIASKVKASPDSKNLMDLTSASRNVTKATGSVVATVKDCNVQLEQSNDIDLCKLTPSQIKTMEMEIHVKVLELEQSLQTQRFKLSAFRREHYQKSEY